MGQAKPSGSWDTEEGRAPLGRVRASASFPLVACCELDASTDFVIEPRHDFVSELTARCAPHSGSSVAAVRLAILGGQF